MYIAWRLFFVYYVTYKSTIFDEKIVKGANFSFFRQIIYAFRKEGFARLKGMELIL